MQHRTREEAEKIIHEIVKATAEAPNTFHSTHEALIVTGDKILDALYPKPISPKLAALKYLYQQEDEAPQYVGHTCGAEIDVQRVLLDVLEEAIKAEKAKQ